MSHLYHRNAENEYEFVKMKYFSDAKNVLLKILIWSKKSWYLSMDLSKFIKPNLNFIYWFLDEFNC